MTNTRRLSTIAILSAISFVLMYFDFPLLPAASFLKIEFSILPVLVGLVVMDLPAALGVLLLRSLLKLLLNSQGVNTYIGLPMNIVALGVFVIVFALILEKGTDNPSFPTRLSSWDYWFNRGYVGSQLCLCCSFVR